MKKNNVKKMAFVLSFALTAPAISLTNGSTATYAVAATTTTTAPKLNVSKKTISGLNKSYTLVVNNLVKGSTCKWSSTNTAVATVTGKGKVTSVSAGTSTIKVKIVAPNKTTKTLSCKITVKVIPSTGVVIKNAPEDNTIKVGESFDYNRTISPSNSTDKTTWSIKNTSIATVDKNGVVTALKAGNTVLTAKTTSGQTDSVPIIVAEKSAEVSKVVLNSGTEIEIHFSEEMDASTLIDTDNFLKNILFERRTNSNSVNANDYGTLTAALSTDAKVLTINSTNIFKGDYEVIIPSTVRTKNNKEVKYDKVLTITDTRKPMLSGTSLDETGVVATLTFSEPINITNFVPSNAKRADGLMLNTTSQSILTNKNNYVLSSDKKSLKIDLSNLATEDQGKYISVILAGITDLTGNPADNITFQFQTDVTTRTQAKVISAARTGYNTITVFFDSPIKTPGTMQIGSNQLVGIRDTNNYRKVTYTLTNTETSLTGNQLVILSDYSGYNTVGVGSSTAMINFTVTSEAPVVTSSKLVTTTVNGVESNALVLTYNKNVTIANTAGTLQATLRADNDDVTSPTIVYTKATVKENQVTLALDNTYVGAAGTYKITLPAAFVKDDFYTNSTETVVSIVKGTGSSSELPAPTIKQSSDDPSEIIVTFTRKVDITTAENVTNYNIPGATILSALVTSNTSNGATVKLTVADGTIVATTVYGVTVTGVKGANDSYAAMSPSIQYVSLIENVSPTVVSTKISSDLKTITLTFSENIKGTPNFLVYQNGTAMSLSSSVQTTITNNKVMITLANTLPSLTNVTVVAGANNSIKDLYNNSAKIGTLVATY